MGVCFEFACKSALLSQGAVRDTWFFVVYQVPSLRDIVALTHYGGLVKITAIIEDPGAAYYRAGLVAVCQSYRLTARVLS